MAGRGWWRPDNDLIRTSFAAHHLPIGHDFHSIPSDSGDRRCRFHWGSSCQRLLQRGDRVIGIDNLNSYYDPALKQARLEAIEVKAPSGAWRFERMALEDLMPHGVVCFREASCGGQPRCPGRGSLFPGEPAAYIQSNLVGFGHLLKVVANTAPKTSSMPRAVRCMGESQSALPRAAAGESSGEPVCR